MRVDYCVCACVCVVVVVVVCDLIPDFSTFSSLSPPLIRFLSLHFSATSKIQCSVEKLSKRYNFTLFRTLEVANGLPVNVSQPICISFIFCVWPYPTVSNHSCLSECGSFNKWLTSITHKYAMAVERIWASIFQHIVFTWKFAEQILFYLWHIGRLFSC